MAITKTAVTVFTAAAIAAAGTKAAPAAGGTGALIVTNDYGTSTLGLRIKNGASAPGVAGIITIQQTPDGGVTWFDYYTIAGTVIVNDDFTCTVGLERGIKGIRALCYGNTTNPVTFEVILTAVAG